MPEIILQDGRDSIHLVCLPESGCVHLRTVDAQGFIKRRDLFDIAEHPEFEALYASTGWYLPLIPKVLKLYEQRNPRTRVDPQRGKRIVPGFVAKHYSR